MAAILDMQIAPHCDHFLKRRHPDIEIRHIDDSKNVCLNWFRWWWGVSAVHNEVLRIINAARYREMPQTNRADQKLVL